MKTVGTFSAKTHLSDLLEQVARGESFLITKRGKPVASLAPINFSKHHGPREDIESFRKQFAKSLRKISQEEMNELKGHGRR